MAELVRVDVAGDAGFSRVETDEAFDGAGSDAA